MGETEGEASSLYFLEHWCEVASSVEQLEQNLGALERLDFSDAELAEIDNPGAWTEPV